jgi:glycine dehydrogenase subunit 1
VKTYAPGFGFEVVEVPHRGGVTDPDELAAAAADAAAVLFQQPNFLGCLEPAPELAAAANDAGALSIAHVDLMSLGVLEAPGAYGCAIALGEGQSAGNWPSYGGPHYGFLAARSDYVRRMPGRIVGETVDGAGRRGYVLTLATREQHIRRERATSNICTNQGLCALAVTVHLAMLGRSGLARLARVNYRAAHDAAQRLDAAGVRRRFAAPFFNEFVVRLPDAEARWEALAERDGVVAGYPLGRWYPELADSLLLCVTETHRREQVVPGGTSSVRPWPCGSWASRPSTFIRGASISSFPITRTRSRRAKARPASCSRASGCTSSI